jgi:hypothetical protein
MRKLIFTILTALAIVVPAIAQNLPDSYASSWPYIAYASRNGPFYNYQGPTGLAISTNLNGGTYHIAFPSTNYPNLAYDIVSFAVQTNSSGQYYLSESSDPYWGNTKQTSERATTVTNEFVTGQYVLLSNARSIVSVTVSATTANNSGVMYSNAVSGLIRNFRVGPTAGTNTITIFCEPGSMFAVTNGTVIANTSEINYQ